MCPYGGSAIGRPGAIEAPLLQGGAAEPHRGKTLQWRVRPAVAGGQGHGRISAPGRAWPLGRVGGSFGLVVRCRHVSPLALSGPSQGCLFPFSLPFLSSSPRFAPFRPLFSPSAVLGGGLCLGWHRFSLACDRARGAWSGRGPGPGRAWAWSGLAGLSGTFAP